MGQLQDRIAIVTGASTGIGRAIALAFAREGAKVALAARKPGPLEAAAREIEAAGGTALAVPTDVTDEPQVLELFRRTLDAHGRLDILVNNAGVTSGAPTEDITLEAWRSLIECNVTGAFLCSREAFKIMKRQGGGRILNIGSISAKVPRANTLGYTTSKFALEGMTRSLAVDGRAHGIAASILQPGNTHTPIWSGREDAMRREGVMNPDDVARVAVAMMALPPEVNFYEAIMLPLTMPALGRG